MIEEPEISTTDADGERGTAANRSILDIMALDRVQREIKYITGVFAIIGLGYGLTAFIAIDQMGGGGDTDVILRAFLGIVMLGFALMSGTVVSTIVGFRLRTRLAGPSRTQYVTGFVGNAVGYIAMTVITVLFISASIDGSGSGSRSSSAGSLTNLGDLLVPLVLLSIPVGLVCAGMMYLHEKVPARAV